jgi:hypothetical protein
MRVDEHIDGRGHLVVPVERRGDRVHPKDSDKLDVAWREEKRRAKRRAQLRRAERLAHDEELARNAAAQLSLDQYRAMGERKEYQP